MKQNSYPHVFQPITIRGLTLKNRLEYAPTVVLKCNADGTMSQDMLDFMQWQAKTGVGWVTVGDTPVTHDNSPVNLAHLFRDDSTRLLIVHGTADDNVHFQNTMEMVRALNKLGKQYDMMVYPDQNHSMMPDDMIHVREKMLRYTLENL